MKILYKNVIDMIPNIALNSTQNDLSQFCKIYKTNGSQGTYMISWFLKQQLMEF